MNSPSSKNSRTLLKYATTFAAAALVLSFGAAPTSLMAQDQPAATQGAQQQAQPQAPEQAAAQPVPPADPQQSAQPAAQSQAPGAPDTLTLPAGTIIPVRVEQWLSSDRNQAGDTFSATLEQPLVVNGWVVARRGQSIIGRVANAQKAGHGQSDSRLGLELSELVLVDGQQLPVSTQLSQKAAGGPSQGQRVGTVAATTAIGAAIGAIAGGGTGAAIGMGVGATAGIGGEMATRGRPTVVAPETLLTFSLQAPLQISTAQSKAAFEPASARDYSRDQDAYARPPAPASRYANGPGHGGPGYGYPAPPLYYGYCSPFGWGCYPYPAPLFLGFYGGYGPGYRGRFYVPLRR